MLLVGASTRWRRVNRAAAEPYWANRGARLVACIWHGRFVQVHKLWDFGANSPKAKFLISRSREGGIVAHASRTVGADVIRGSAAKPSRCIDPLSAPRAVAPVAAAVSPSRPVGTSEGVVAAGAL